MTFKHSSITSTPTSTGSELPSAETWGALRFVGSEAHLWSVELDLASPPDPALQSVLSAEELERADRFRFERDRHRAIYSASLIRHLLAAYTGISPRCIEIVRSARGKPSLARGSIEFNLAHSGSVLSLAFARHAPVGVDVERRRNIPEAAAISERFFTSAERSILNELTGEERLSAFLRGWTRKEACLKALGSGLSVPLSHFEVTLRSDEAPRVVTVEGKPGPAAEWTLFDFTPAASYVGCLAVHAPQSAVRARTLDPRRLVRP